MAPLHPHGATIGWLQVAGLRSGLPKPRDPPRSVHTGELDFLLFLQEFFLKTRKKRKPLLFKKPTESLTSGIHFQLCNGVIQVQDDAGTAGPASSRSLDSRKHLSQALRGSLGSCRSLSRSIFQTAAEPSLQHRARGLPGTKTDQLPSREGT